MLAAGRLIRRLKDGRERGGVVGETPEEEPIDSGAQPREQAGSGAALAASLRLSADPSVTVRRRLIPENAAERCQHGAPQRTGRATRALGHSAPARASSELAPAF